MSVITARGARIERTAFRTSRMLDFLSEKDLAAQCGHGPDEWGLVLVKELVDNAIDACEEQGIAPEITITMDEHSVVVADNGSGVPAELVDLLLDFSIKVSSREAYVSPDRGAQGNALKTIVAMPFVVDGEQGRVDITGGGVKHEISFSVDRIAQRPVADVTRTPEAGSEIRVWWPTARASSSSGERKRVLFLQEDWFRYGDVLEVVEEEADQVRTLATSFAFLNPHLTLTLDLFGTLTRIEATNPGWEKWTPSSPTSPHWYDAEHLERLLGAYITHDRQNGDRERTVREFVSEFRGLTSTIKQKQVLAELGLARAPLSCLLTPDDRNFDHETVGRLLTAMKQRTKPVAPKHLGVIGRDHAAARFAELDIHEESFEYQRKMSLGDDGLPQVTEVAFAALQDEEANRVLITGVNWSAAWVNPFRQLGAHGRSLDTILEDRRFASRQPIVLLVHVAHPRVTYTDRGKSTVLAT